MPYVTRNNQGNITALQGAPSDTCSEYLPPDHHEIAEFIQREGKQADIKLALKDSDSEFARATEDLIHLLVKKNLILFTELPDAVQAKLLAREKLREQLGQLNNQSPLSEDETI